MNGKRIQLIDAARGLCVVLMVAHHFLYDLVVFLDAPAWLFDNPLLNFLHYIFAGLFILLSGVSSRFSRSNIKRGAKVFAIAMGMTLVTYFINMPIRFGVLHLLGFSMIFYGLTEKLWLSIPGRILPAVCVLLAILSARAANGIPTGYDFLWMFGFIPPGFYSADYFPIFPWLFVFLFGTWAGGEIKAGHLPGWFYEKSVPFFPSVGRKALIIYIIHQPVLYCVTLLIRAII
jgi:uncharacterized membrane protein